MEKLKYIIKVLTVIIIVILSFDDVFPSFTPVDTIEIPLQSDCSDVSHHHHNSLADHFFQRTIVTGANCELLTDCWSFLNDRPISDQYLSSIWQPPQKA